MVRILAEVQILPFTALCLPLGLDRLCTLQLICSLNPTVQVTIAARAICHSLLGVLPLLPCTLLSFTFPETCHADSLIQVMYVLHGEFRLSIKLLDVKTNPNKGK